MTFCKSAHTLNANITLHYIWVKCDELRLTPTSSPRQECEANKTAILAKMDTWDIAMLKVRNRSNLPKKYKSQTFLFTFLSYFFWPLLLFHLANNKLKLFFRKLLNIINILSLKYFSLQKYWASNDFFRMDTVFRGLAMVARLRTTVNSLVTWSSSKTTKDW